MKRTELTREEKIFYAEKCKKENKTSVITPIGLWGPWMDQLENLFVRKSSVSDSLNYMETYRERSEEVAPPHEWSQK